MQSSVVWAVAVCCLSGCTVPLEGEFGFKATNLSDQSQNLGVAWQFGGDARSLNVTLAPGGIWHYNQSVSMSGTITLSAWSENATEARVGQLADGSGFYLWIEILPDGAMEVAATAGTFPAKE